MLLLPTYLVSHHSRELGPVVPRCQPSGQAMQREGGKDMRLCASNEPTFSGVAPILAGPRSRAPSAPLTGPIEVV